MKRHLIRVTLPIPPTVEEAPDGAWVTYGDALEHARTALTADRARIAAAIREESHAALVEHIEKARCSETCVCRIASERLERSIVARLLRVVEGG